MRLIVVSNRLPFTLKQEKEEDRISFTPSAGGLATGLSGYLNGLPQAGSAIDSYIWLGWLGDEVPEKKALIVGEELLEQHHIYPVPVSPEAVKNYYHGFSNQTLWPLLHGLLEHVVIDDTYWEWYRMQNQVFADAIAHVVKPDDVIWIHDFHLALVPKLLRDKKITNPIGFFLHIPFPTVEQLGKVPAAWVREILDGMNKATLLGFHIPEYADNYALALESYDRRIHARKFHSFTQVEDFPIGIKFERFYNALFSPVAQKERRAFLKKFARKKIISSVDRLDYTKGIVERLQGIELFLDTYPEWKNKWVYYMVVVPSRGEVGDYGTLKKKIEAKVKKINKKYSSDTWQPIEYIYDSIPFDQMAALYNVSTAGLVTPLKDGMNLVAKEFVAAKSDEPGMLILSKFAGAAEELTEALLIDPREPSEIADALHAAFTMPASEQVRRNRAMQEKLKTGSLQAWADDFLKELIEVHESNSEQ